MAEPAAKRPPAAPAFRPSRGKVAVVFGTLLLVLGAAVALFVLGLRYKRKYGEMVRKENARLQASLLLEYARDNLARTERLARRADPDPAEIREMCENSVTAASRAAELRRDLEEPFLIRGRALEMQYRFDEAEADYAEAIRNYKFSYAVLHRGFLGLRRHSRMLLLDPAPKAAAALADRASEDLRLHTYHSQGEVQDERNRFVAQLGVTYFDSNFSVLPALCDNAARFDPCEWFCPYIKGLALARTDRPEEAVRAFEEASVLFPYAAEPHAWRGSVLRKTGRLPEAIDAFGAAVRRDEQFLEAVYLRGTALLDARRFEEARADFLFCAKVRPSFADARARAASAGFEWWRRSGRKDAELLRNVQAELDALLADAPGQVEARVTRLRVLVETGEFERALADADEILAKEPGRADALELRARIRVARKEWDAADRDLSAAGNVRERARVRVLAGRFDEALADIDLLLLKDPKDLSLLLERARVQIAAGRPDDALATLDRLAESPPRAKVVRAEAMLAKKDAAAAAKLATEAIESDPQLAEAFLVRGRAHLALGNQPAAEEDFKKAVEMDPAMKERVPR